MKPKIIFSRCPAFIFTLIVASLAGVTFSRAADARPNILWLIAESACKDSGYYGTGVTNPACNRMRQLFAEGKLNADQSQFMAVHRLAEDLCDLQSDPFELHNLADDPAHRATLERLRQQLDAWIADTHDHGAVLEDPQTVAQDLKRDETTEKKLRVEFGLGEHGVLLKVPHEAVEQP